MSNELSVGNVYVPSQLTADALLGLKVYSRIYADLAPQTTPETDSLYPLVIFNLQSATDIRSLNAVRGYVTMLYLVKGVGRNGYGELTDIADRIDACLDNQKAVPITVGSNSYRVYSYRQSSLQYAEVQNGVIYRHRGGLYRVEVQAL